jgi:hypothetical protein
LQPWAMHSRAVACDSTPLEIGGGVWHKKHREQGASPIARLIQKRGGASRAGTASPTCSPAVEEKGGWCGITGLLITRYPHQETPFSMTECSEPTPGRTSCRGPFRWRLCHL